MEYFKHLDLYYLKNNINLTFFNTHRFYFLLFLPKISIMKIKLRLLWYWIEAIFCSVLRFFGFKPSIDDIPNGYYCYKYIEDEKTSASEVFCIKTCKYYRSTPLTGGVGCAYLGFFGFDAGLYDQCKICGEKME